MNEPMLSDLIDNQRTDKNTYHSYLGVYQKLFSPKRTTAKNVLEIGVGWVENENGGSIKLWRDYFLSSKRLSNRSAERPRPVKKHINVPEQLGLWRPDQDIQK